MKYKTQHYAEALYGALKGKTALEQKEILKRFIRTLDKNKDRSKLNLILRNVEKEYLKSSGLCKIDLETVDGATESLKENIKSVVGQAIFTEKKNKDLGAGVKMLVNDHILIDATAENYLRKIFN
jgi:F0F1-type ATP synthase delta subunit